MGQICYYLGNYPKALDFHEQADKLFRVEGAQDFLEKGPGSDPLGIQVKVAAPLLEDFVRTTDGVVNSHGGVVDAVLRFTHAEAISPFATLLGIAEASVAVPDI